MTQLGTKSILVDERSGEEKSAALVVGPRLVTDFVRLFQTAAIYGPEHNQVRHAATTLTTWLTEAFVRFGRDSFALQMTEHNVFLDGEMIRFEEGQYARGLILRATMLTYAINQLKFAAGLAPGELLAFLVRLDAVKRGREASFEDFAQPHLGLAATRLTEIEGIEDRDERREIIELYAGLVIKCATYFEELRTNPGASARFIKRLVQKITDRYETHGHVFIGLINLKLLGAQDFVHGVNTALYAMFIARRVGLDRLDLVRVAMTAITQDIHRIRRRLDEATEIELGEKSHFDTNMTSVVMLSELGARDMLSALRLVTSYERGFPYDSPLPPQWYRQELRPHLLSRIIEIARHYDVLTQGMEGHEPVKPDLALQSISEQMGRHYDPRLTKLFINIVGVYPVGEVVLLSTNERAVVVRSPSVADTQKNRSVAHRPTVRLLDGSERLMDLGAEEHATVTIVEIVDAADLDERPGAFFFF